MKSIIIECTELDDKVNFNFKSEGFTAFEIIGILTFFRDQKMIEVLGDVKSETNQKPACASCNINKHSLSLEEFRSLIQGFMKYLNQLKTQYKIAKRYGLVKEDIKPIIFYFESIK